LGILATVATTMGLTANAQAQDLSVKSSGSSNDVFASTNTSTAAQDRVGVHGVSTPQGNWGYGGKFEGGYVGAFGYATGPNGGTRTGLYGIGVGGTTAYGVYGGASNGSSASWSGYFSGNVYVGGTLTQASDLKFKLGIKDMDAGALGLVLRLRPRSYRYRTTEFPKMAFPEGDQVGFVAQEIQGVLPGVVREVVAPSDPGERNKAPEAFLGVDYIKLVPVLVKAVQEQQAQIDSLKAQLAKLQ
jgi:hypothetical protein